MPEYLNKKTIEFLLDKSTPEIRYLTLKEFFPHETRAINLAYENLLKSSEIKKLLNKGGSSPLLGDEIHFDNNEKGLVRVFCELVERGLDLRNNRVKATASYIIDKLLVEERGFSIDWKPLKPVIGWSGEILYRLLKIGEKSPILSKVVDWICTEQNSDGSWSYFPEPGVMDTLRFILFKRSPARISRNKTTSGDLKGTITCARALLEYKDLFKDDSYDSVIEKAMRYIELNFHLPLKNKRVGYSYFENHNFITTMNFIAKYGGSENPKIIKAFNRVVSQMNHDGTWDRNKDQLLYSADSIGQPDKWTTFECAKLMKYAGQL